MTDSEEENHIHALFKSHEDARGARAAIVNSDDFTDDTCTAIHDEPIVPGIVGIEKSTAAESSVKGALALAAGGAAGGGLATVPWGLGGLTTGVAIAGASVIGATYGGLAGSLTGSDELEAKLRVINDEIDSGSVLLHVCLAEPERESSRCSQVVQRFGGRVL